MIAILYNLIYLPILLINFGLANLILFAVTPVGFTLLSSLLIFLEYLVGRSILSDPNRINFGKVFNYIKNYRIKDASITPSQWKILDLVFNNRNIGNSEISDSIGITIGASRKLMRELIDNGYIARGLNINDSHAFCYITTDKYKAQMAYNI
jgi:hypothetical protein